MSVNANVSSEENPSSSSRKTRQVSNINIVKLNGRNYQTWRFQIRRVLASRKLTDVVYNELNLAQDEDLLDQDAEAAEILSGTLDPSVIPRVANCETAHQIWSRLEKVHHLKGDANLETIINNFCSVKMDINEDMSSYIGRVESLAAELRSLGEPISERLVRARLIGGLSSKYMGFSRVWNSTSSDEKTLEHLIERLIQDESEVKQKSSNREITENSALMAKSRNPKSFKGKLSIEQQKILKSDSICHKCGRKGHWARDCRSGPRDTRYDRGDRGNRANSNNLAFMANQLRDLDKDCWYVDSGASAHMTNNLALFSEYLEYNEKRIIMMGNSSKLEALGSGTIRFTNLREKNGNIFYLKNVMYVPGLAANLLSVGVSTRNGIQVTFDDSQCRLIYQGNVIAEGSRHPNQALFELQIQQVGETAWFMKEQRTLDDWHRSLGHIGMQQVIEMVKNGSAEGMTISPNKIDLECGDCPLGKAINASHPSSTRERASVVGQIVHTDLIGPIMPSSLGGSKYILLFTDEFSHYRVVYMLKTKDETCDKIQNFISLIENESGKRLRSLWCDQGTEFVNQKVQIMLDLEHITMMNSAAYTPQQNGAAERSNRTVIEMTRTMLNASGLDHQLWAEAVNTSVYLLNRTIQNKNGNKTPFEMWSGRKPNIAHIHEFGKSIHILDNSRRILKWSAKTKAAHLVGFTNRSNTYRCFIPETREIKVSCDVVFKQHPKIQYIQPSREVVDTEETIALVPEERKTNSSRNVLDEYFRQLQARGGRHESTPSITRHNDETVYHEAVDTSSRYDRDTANVSEPESIRESTDCHNDSMGDQLASQTSEARESSMSHEDNTATPPVLSPIRDDDLLRQNEIVEISERVDAEQPSRYNDRPRRQIKRKTFTDFVGLLAYKEPKSYDDAIACEEGELWQQAIKQEIKSLEANHTWKIVDLPKGRQPLTARWLFKLKMLPSGEVERYKARLVVRGFNQRAGFDFFETYAPVARYDTIRCLLAICAYQGLEIVQFDIETAFLNGVLEEDIYLYPPEGISCPRDHVLKLEKSLYGLKQSPRCWKVRFDAILSKLNIIATVADPCLYRGEYKGHRIFMVVYVDDGLIASSNKAILDDLINEIGKEVSIRYVRSNCFVGFEIERKQSNEIAIHQQSYINNMLKTYNMVDCKPISTPINDINHLNTTSENDKNTTAPYRELIGSLNYCACLCRPDITYAVGVLSKYNQDPKEKHWVAAKRVLRYLSGTKTLGIKYYGTDSLDVECYSDADWAGDCDTRKSTSGIIVLLSDGPVIFRSKIQTVVALSTTEAEYVSSSLAVRELTWLQSLLRELDLEIKKPCLYLDNQSAIKLIKNPEFHGRTKHIDIRVHHVREQYNSDNFELQYIISDEQKADILTKPLSNTKHAAMTSKIGLTAMICCIAMLISTGEASFGIEDLVVWRATKISHIHGQDTMELDLKFQDPCSILFSNLTSVPKIDKVLSRTCSKRFNSSVLDEIGDLCEYIQRRKERDAGLSTIAGGALLAGVSAVVASSYYTINARDKDKESEHLRMLMINLEEQIHLLKDTVVISNNRMSNRINSLERDVDLIAATLQAQPEITDALFETILRFDEVRRNLRHVKENLKIGGEIPSILLELFNITRLATSATLHHSSLLQCHSKSKDGARLVLSLFKVSDQVDILRADPFSYWSADKERMCKFVYSGPEYILFNQTSNCARPLLHGEVLDDIVLGEGCLTRKPFTENKVYEATICEKINKTNIKIPPVQIKHNGQYIQINCQGHFISIDGTKTQCPNSIFTVGMEKSFTIDDYYYKHDATNVSRPRIDYSIPTKINLMLGTAHAEFNSLTAEELSNLQNIATGDIRKTLAEELTRENTDTHLSIIGRTVERFVDLTGEYVAILIFLFLLFLFIKTRFLKHRNTPATVMAILLIVPSVLAHDHLIKLQLSRERATNEIIRHQEYMQKSWCSDWRISDDRLEYENHRGYYPQTLACLLALKEFSCPCASTAEWVPVVRHDQVDDLVNYSNDECPIPTPKLDEQTEEQVDLLRIFSDHLCERARHDNWPKDKMHKLVSSGCLLARKMFNCACTGQYEHKPVIFDQLTIRATKAIHESMKNNTKRCELNTVDTHNRTSVFELYYDVNRRA